MIICRECAKEFEIYKLVEALQKASNDMIQVRGMCPYCGIWFKWVPYRESDIVRDVIRAFYNGDFEKLKEMRDISIYKGE